MLYDKVLSEDPSNPAALAYAGFLQWNVGTTAQRGVARADRARRDRDGHQGLTELLPGPPLLRARPRESGSQRRRRGGAVQRLPGRRRRPPPSCPRPPRSSAAPTRRPGFRCRPSSAPARPRRPRRQLRSARRSATTRGNSSGERAAVLVGRRPPDADPQRVAGVDAHRLEHRRRLDALGRAGGARMDGDAGPVQPDEHGLGLDAVHAEADQMGEPGLRRRARRPSTPSTASAASTTEAICRRAVAASVVSARLRSAGQRGGRGAEGEQGRERLEPGPAPAFLFAAHEEGLEPAAAPHDQRTGTGHPAELVRADADQVGVERGEVRRARARRPRRRPRGR